MPLQFKVRETEWLLREETQKTAPLVLVPSQSGVQMLQTRKVQRECRAQAREHYPWSTCAHTRMCTHGCAKTGGGTEVEWGPSSQAGSTGTMGTMKGTRSAAEQWAQGQL